MQTKDPSIAHSPAKRARDNSGIVREASDALESEDRYRALVASSLDAVLVTSPDGRICGANEAACELFGRSEEELIRLRQENLVDASEARPSTAFEERHHGRGFRGELPLLRADGSKFPGHISSARFRTSAGEVRTIMVIRDRTSHKLVEAQLARSWDAHRALTQKMDTMREEEQKRLARQVHDELGHAFTDLKLDLAWIDRRLVEAGYKSRCAIRRRIAHLARRLDAHAQAVRRIGTALRPAVLDALGLGAAIEWQAREFEMRSQVRCTVSIQDNLPAMSSAQVTTLFRILQEVLSNIARHANATFVAFDLSHEAGVIRLCVRDNGCGITPAELANPTALGLLGMRERAAALGGQLNVQGVRGEGTTVTVSVPAQPA
jgi:PAS domain S-box-containing protein